MQAKPFILSFLAFFIDEISLFLVTLSHSACLSVGATVHDTISSYDMVSPNPFLHLIFNLQSHNFQILLLNLHPQFLILQQPICATMQL